MCRLCNSITEDLEHFISDSYMPTFSYETEGAEPHRREARVQGCQYGGGGLLGLLSPSPKA